MTLGLFLWYILTLALALALALALRRFSIYLTLALVSTCLQAFFYEPYQGAIHGPQSFVIGLGRGTGSLVGGVVGGAMMSTSAIVS